MRKLLHIFPTFGLGGQQRRLVDLINAIGADLTHDIISLSEDCEAGDLIKDQAQTRIRTLLLAKGGFFNIENIRRLQSEFVRSNPDYLCTYNWGSIEAVFAWHLSRRNLKKSRSALAHLHFEDGFGPDETIEQQNIKRVMLRRMALRQSLTIVPSTTLEWLAHERWKLPADRIRRIGNGIDLDRFFHPERAYSTADPLTIGTVGAFRPEKRLDRLMDCTALAAHSVSLSLSMVGDGPQMNSLRQRKEAVSKDLSVILPGATNEPEAWYRQFDIFCLSSDTEQMPISLIEAMASGLPVVATDVGDIKAMVSEANRPFITLPGDDRAFSQSLTSLAMDADLRKNLGTANKAKAEQEFSRVKMVDAYRALFGVLT